MATLKDHQQAMVDLLASGSGIPASASRLAHAMHDVLSAILAEPDLIAKAIQESKAVRTAYTTPGLNDKALAGDIEVCRPKATRLNVNINLADMDEVKMALQNMQSHLDGARDSQRKAERRVKELENTCKQLRASNAVLKAERNKLRSELDFVDVPEQAGCRKDDTQECLHLCTGTYDSDGKTLRCDTCGAEMPE